MPKSIRFRRNVLTSALLLVIASPIAATAQEASSESGTTTQLDTVTVTGSRIKRAQVEGPAPVNIITGDQIRKEGFATAYDALSTLTEAIGTVESDSQWGQHTSNASPLNMRNMGPGRSLLLINGHRAADYPLPYGGQSNFQNFSNIPAAAIERIEVLASGASAIYGSDAVAGVVNVVLKKDFAGDELRIKGGVSTRGGRDMADLSWTGGRSGDKWSLTYSLQYFKREPLFAGQRDFMDSENDAARPSWSEAELAKGNRFNNYYDTARISRVDNGMRISPPAGACDSRGFGGVTSLQDYREYNQATHTLEPSMGQYCANEKNFHNWTINDGQESASLYLYGTYDFSDKLQGWSSVSVFDSEGASSIGDFAMGYVPQVKWYDQGVGAYVEGKRFLTRREIGDALTHTNERSYDVAFGLNGRIADRFDWEASFDHAEYKLKKSYPATVPALVNNYYLGAQQGVTDASYAGVPVGTPIHTADLNRFFTPIDKQQWEAMSTHGHDRAESKSDQFQFVISGDLFQGWAGPVSFAAVAEAARQSYAIHPDPKTVPALGQTAPGPNLFVTEYGSPYYGYDLGGGSRTRWALGSEFRVPLWESKTPGLGSATANVAARYDDYSQTLDGSKVTWMTGLEWRPLDNLLVRGSYATSFRAPDMHYVYAQGGQSYVQLVDALRCGQNGDYGQCVPQNGDSDPATSNYYRSVTSREGSPLLKYEEGKSWTAGFVWDIRDNLSVSADYWDIELKNAIENIGLNDILAAELGCALGTTTDGAPYVNPLTGQAPTADFCQLMQSRIERDGPNGAITGVQEGPINKSGRRVAGFDVAAKYRLATERFGDFTFGLNYTNLLKLSTRDSEASEWTDGKKGAHNDIHTKLRASLGWEKGNFTSTLLMTRLARVRGANFGGCWPFANGERGTPIDDDTCVGTDATSVNFNQTSKRYWDRLKAPVIFNLTAGYRISDQASINLYVNNLFDNAGYKDPFKGDYIFSNDRVWSFIGREFAMEYVFRFK